MVALLAILFRAGLLALTILWVWRLFFGHTLKRPPRKPSSAGKTKRFDASGKNISDGDFKEL